MEEPIVNIDKMECFLKEIKKDKSVIFDFEKTSSFERELFLSVQFILVERYNYHLDGLTRTHFKLFSDYLKKGDIVIDKKIKEIIHYALSVYSILTDRNVSLGYNILPADNTIEDDNWEKIIVNIEGYIKKYKSLKI